MDCLVLLHEAVLYLKGLNFELMEKRAENYSYPSFFKNKVFLADKVIGNYVRMIVVQWHSDVFLDCVLLQCRK